MNILYNQKLDRGQLGTGILGVYVPRWMSLAFINIMNLKNKLLFEKIFVLKSDVSGIFFYILKKSIFKKKSIFENWYRVHNSDQMIKPLLAVR